MAAIYAWQIDAQKGVYAYLYDIENDKAGYCGPEISGDTLAQLQSLVENNFSDCNPERKCIYESYFNAMVKKIHEYNDGEYAWVQFASYENYFCTDVYNCDTLAGPSGLPGTSGKDGIGKLTVNGTGNVIGNLTYNATNRELIATKTSAITSTEIKVYSAGTADNALKLEGSGATAFAKADHTHGNYLTSADTISKATSATTVPWSGVSGKPSFDYLPLSGGTLTGGVTGTSFTSSGGFFDTSDERLKDFGNEIEVNIDLLKNIPTKYFTWKNDNSKQYIGTSAQKIEEQFPEIVDTDENGIKSVDYAKLSIIALKAIKELTKRIEDLENKIS